MFCVGLNLLFILKTLTLLNIPFYFNATGQLSGPGAGKWKLRLELLPPAGEELIISNENIHCF